MFNYSAPFDYSQPPPFSHYPSSSLSSTNAYIPPSYASYDEERSRIEQALLARKQQERRKAEAAAFLAEQRRLERQAMIEEAIREERGRREYERALRYREEMIRKAKEEEEGKQRYIQAMRVQQELARRQQLEEQQEQRRRNERAAEQRQVDQDRIPDLLELLFGGRSAHSNHQTSPRPTESAPAPKLSTPSPVQAQSTRTEEPQFDLPHFLEAIFGTPQPLTTTQASPTSQQAPALVSKLSPSPVVQLSSSPSSAPVLSTPAPTSTPTEQAETPVDSPSSDEEEEAATKVQRHFRRHLARRNALDKISSLSTDFLDRQSTFEKPSTFIFKSSLDSISSTTTPPLAFVSSNSPFLAYEDYLVNLLSKIDAVESGGDRQVKKERKSLVRKVEKELSRLDAMKERAWEEQVKAVKAESMQEDKEELNTAAEPVQDTPTSSDSPAPITSDSTEREDDPLPSLVPLTHDAVCSLPNSTPPSLSRSPSDSGSSTTSSTLTVSSASSQVDQYISEMLRRAQKLGEQVEKMELEEESKPSEVALTV